jgi:hypothetical protein
MGSFGNFEVFGKNQEEAMPFRHPKGDANGRERPRIALQSHAPSAMLALRWVAM